MMEISWEELKLNRNNGHCRNNHSHIQNNISTENLNYMVGNSSEFNINNKNCDIKVDILAEEHAGVRIWGQIKDINNIPVDNALVKLIKPTITNGNLEYISIAHCISDINGFYQFEVNCNENDAAFKILVSKSRNTNIAKECFRDYDTCYKTRKEEEYNNLNGFDDFDY